MEQENTVLNACKFISNSNSAVLNYAGRPQFISCRFIRNSSSGIMNCGSDPTLINCLFLENEAIEGAAICNSFAHPDNRIPSRPKVLNCTIVENRSSGRAGGIFNSPESSPALVNCILWGNRDSQNEFETAQIHGGTTIVNYSCIQGWNGKLGGTGNFGLNPLFVDSNSPDSKAGTLDDDLRLSVNSPCINAGDNSALSADTFDLDGDDDPNEPIPFDIDGNPRILNGNVDIGANESG